MIPDLDIYSFRSEFPKIVEPPLQCLWANYLKKNYLGGSALSLVSKEDSVDQIWEKNFLVWIYSTLTPEQDSWVGQMFSTGTLERW